ncbi:DNA-binding response regulator, OmpR family, contains REC and winged-helix (wHTH) domain [Desulfotomaculum arcticum]|uniref:Stage 0 sporulation protein A homolog n=1 Tax=Desulfotruncus arcticus DSM 17038 TaxID=1121424 RepID=A0A1I2W140_9FIRM|nr:response regulator transcription factor [Desulfotruncus arcticus]SFG94307.1 DNA-binding response regulator, OmpR family, contains REC and winged-helix (wHTH) domain [Desulfotomaculum arcticum] [Desulfotruncus arcticus DSM 17038]
MEGQERILVVEDEESIRRFILINLERNSFQVMEAASGEEALARAKTFQPHLVVLDIMLPGMDGFEVCRRLRVESPGIAVIMLTARSQDMDKVMGLELGADDYVIKPFNPLELVARIRAVLRRMQIVQPASSQILCQGPFRLDDKARRIYKNNRKLDLTPREYCLLKIFLENGNRALSRDRLLNLAWGEDFVGDPKTVDVHIRRLREKIEDSPAKPAYIETVWGLGYRWRKEDKIAGH